MENRVSRAVFILLLIGTVTFMLYQIASNVKVINTVETITNTKTINVETEVTVKKINSSDDFRIVTIDGCEYIMMEKLIPMGSGRTTIGSLTHKGNCKFCVERNKK